MRFFINFRSLSEILLNRHREIQCKTDFMDNVRRLESDISYSRGQNERIIAEKKQIEKELKIAQNKHILLEKTYKEMMFFF